MSLSTIVKSPARRVVQAILRRDVRREAEGQSFRRHNERPYEFAFVFRQVGRLCPRTVLDVGTGSTALPALLRSCGCVVTASDNVRDYWPEGITNRHWHVVDDDITQTSLTGPYDLVTCVSVVEHVIDHRAAVRNMLGLLAPQGHLILTCPYTEHEFVENVYTAPGVRAEFRDLPYVGRSYSRAELDGWLADGGAELVEQEFWQTNTGRHHGQGEWQLPALGVGRDTPHQHTCLLIRRKG